jgi:4-oxalocrotonate tautomerase
MTAVPSPTTHKEKDMPFARLTIADPNLSLTASQDLAGAVTDLLDTVLLKDRAAAVVHVNLVSATSWYVAGANQPSATGAHLEVSITAGTNSAEEKAAFLRGAYELLSYKLGTLPAAVYVALYELDGEAYGYNGISQTARHQQAPATRD